MMYVSPQVEKANPMVDYLLQGWKEARLLKPSFARPKIAAVEPELVVHRVGVLSARDLRGVELCLVKAFGLEATLLAQINLAVQPATFVQALTERALAGAVAKAAAGEAGINLLLLQEMLKTNQS
jgi:hypothetical protein